MLLKRVEIVFKQPITCHDCGALSETEARTLELLDVDSTDIDHIVKRQRIGKSFPVGWASYYDNPTDIYRCPKCIK